MAREEVTEPGPFGGAFDQARDVGEHEALFRTHAHDAEMRMQRREGIVRNLRTGVRDGRDEGGLPGVRKTEEAHVGEDLQFEFERAVLPGFARRALLGRAVDGTLEVKVPEAALAARGEELTRAVMVEVGDGFARIGVAHDRAHGHAQFNVLAARAVAVGAAPVFAVRGEELARRAVVAQGVDVSVGHGPDRAAPSAVTAVGTALGDEFFTAETRGAVPAFAALHFNAGFVHKLHDGYLAKKEMNIPKEPSRSPA